jgi:hypothetical protein
MYSDTSVYTLKLNHNMIITYLCICTHAQTFININNSFTCAIYWIHTLNFFAFLVCKKNHISRFVKCSILVSVILINVTAITLSPIVTQTGRFGPKPNRPQWKNRPLDVSTLFRETFRPYYDIMLDWLTTINLITNGTLYKRLGPFNFK